MLMPCNALPLPTITRTERSHTTQTQKQRDLQDASNHIESSDDEEQYWSQRVRHHHCQPQGDLMVSAPATELDQDLQRKSTELRVDAEEFQVEMVNGQGNAEHDTSASSDTVASPGQPSEMNPELSEPQPRRSQRERCPRKILTYDAFGQPVQRAIGHSVNPLYASAAAPPFYDQFGVPWAALQMPYYAAYVPVSYY